MSNPTFIGIKNRSFEVGSALTVCDGCGHPFLCVGLNGWNACRVCLIDGPEQGRKARDRQKARQRKRQVNNTKAARLNPAWFPNLPLP